MATSFTDYQGHGFWANDAFLEVWLAALAEAIPQDAPSWLLDAGHRWQEQAGAGFKGCVDARLNATLTSPQRTPVVLRLAESAVGLLGDLADPTGFVPAPWLNDRHIGGDMSSGSGNIRLDYVLQVANAFTSLLRGELESTPSTSPVFPLADETPAE